MDRKKIFYYTLICILISLYILNKSVDQNEGNDIKVYLYAAKQLVHHENIYQNNPFNPYLYSPLFALILRPLCVINWTLSRYLWTIFNIILVYRLWILLKKLATGYLTLNNKYKNIWLLAVAFISIGYINLNLSLGQVTILILWLTIEGLVLIFSGENIKGSALIGLGINIKILPIILLFYLFFKSKYSTICYITLFSLICLILPATIIGYKYNLQLLQYWKNSINPSQNKYVFEYDDANQGLNAILPAYFSDHLNKENNSLNNQIISGRQIMHFSYKSLVSFMQIFRIELLILLILVINYRKKERKPANFNLYLFWEIGFLMLISLLIFPHQTNYSMLYFIPAGSYFVFYYLVAIYNKFKLSLIEKMTGFIGFILLFICSIRGRDIIGDYLVNLIDYYHLPGINNFIFLVILFINSPYRILNKNNIC